MHLIEPGCGTYYLKELQFSDDPIRKELTEEDLKHQEDAAIEMPRKTATGWEVTRDIQLGEGVKDYKGCTANK
jgi:protocatechuate 3,4-dioxygenase beta subunit